MKSPENQRGASIIIGVSRLWFVESKKQATIRCMQLDNPYCPADTGKWFSLKRQTCASLIILRAGCFLYGSAGKLEALQ
jgi:hypothetical protein